GAGLFAGGTSYVSILGGGSGNALTTAGLGRKAREWRQRAATKRGALRGAEGPAGATQQVAHGLLARGFADDGAGVLRATSKPQGTGAAGILNASSLMPDPHRAPWRARGVVHAQVLASLLFRLATESADFFGTMARFAAWFGSNRHEFRFLLNHLGVGTLATELGKGGAILDLVRGVPRTFVCLHEYDEFSHRRGTRDALRVFPQLDRAVEALFAIASEVPDPPDVWILTDHGQIPAVPFERLFGRTLSDWLADPQHADLPESVSRLVGDAGPSRPHAPPTVVDCGNYAHVYLGGERAWDASEIARLRPSVLARALDCPGVGLVAMRSLRHGPIAFAGGRRADPAHPHTIPKGATAQGVAALLADLESSPSSGDLVLYGSWFDDACVAFAWELSSHGGPSPEETGTFVIHPAGIELSRVAHGADLHATLHALYGAQETSPSA
ncbi:MAG TPA: hypothetical protein VGD74_04175, partial [Vulgatibacter sp.]